VGGYLEVGTSGASESYLRSVSPDYIEREGAMGSVYQAGTMDTTKPRDILIMGLLRVTDMAIDINTCRYWHGSDVMIAQRAGRSSYAA
jgi:hypothetical protein